MNIKNAIALITIAAFAFAPLSASAGGKHKRHKQSEGSAQNVSKSAQHGKKSARHASKRGAPGKGSNNGDSQKKKNEVNFI
jgi:hypothetical protein